MCKKPIQIKEGYMNTCPVCNAECGVRLGSDLLQVIECKRCGEYRISVTTLITLLNHLSDRGKDDAAKVSFSLRRITSNNRKFVLTSENFNSLAAETVLPTPPEQLDNLIYFLGESDFEPGREIKLLTDEHFSAVGARSLDNLGFIVDSAINKGLVEATVARRSGAEPRYLEIANIRLTIDGWTAYLDMKRGKTDGKQAFMAMKFGDAVMDDIYLNHVKGAVSAAGFDLKRLDEGQSAGLIDDQLRVQIRKSRFLIADLTHHNNGAYWEAGYAEGLGKPVIYTCRKDVFDDKANTTHFDTNHHLTVVWEEDKLEEAVKKLKATIRATLPEDAKMEDNPAGE